MSIINCTPHTLNIVTDNVTLEIPASGICPRVSTEVKQVGYDEETSIPLFKTVYGTVENLPEPKANTLFVVSAMVKSACPERHDLVSPGPAIRDSEGRIIGCQGLTF